jgi:hypothetical protein
MTVLTACGDESSSRELDSAHIFEMGGAIERGGAVRLTGQVTIGGDVTHAATGEAIVSRTAGGYEIAGSLEDSSTIVAFAMARSLAGVSSRFSDQYVFAFQPSPSRCDCPSVACISLTVPASGIGMSTSGGDVNLAGTQVGSISTRAVCDLAIGAVALQDELFSDRESPVRATSSASTERCADSARW